MSSTVFAGVTCAAAHRAMVRGARCRGVGLWITALSLLAVVGCTKSHDLAAPEPVAGAEPAAGSGGRAGGGSGGRGAGAGGGASAGSGGPAAGSGEGPEGCALCPAPNFIAGLIGATSCCTADDRCGVTAALLGITQCQPLNAPGAEDPDCPTVTVANLLPLSGCCRPDGTCGSLDGLVGLGCIDSGAPSPVPCTP